MASMSSSTTSSNGASTSSSPTAGQVVSEYVVRVPKATKKKFNVMRFMSSSTVDVSKWTSVKMERENNKKDHMEEDAPIFGAGSEFGREQREEARRKKYGMASRNYKVDDQPWLLKVGGKTGKKYKGIRGGGITENASYYVFTQASDGAFDAYPIEEWYNFTPIQRYKALSAEEAEEEFGRREKVMNYFSIMLRKRLTLDERGNENLDGEEKAAEKKKGKKKKAKSDLKLTDMDEWLSDSDAEDSEENNSDNDDKKSSKDKKAANKKGKGKAKKKKSKKEKGSDDEALEDSDEGDFDDREVDYMSESSSSDDGEEKEDKANKEMKGVEDEEALLKLNVSDEEEEEEPEKPNEEEKKDGAVAGDEKAAATDDKKPEAKNSKGVKADKKGSSGESSAESSDSDFDDSKFQSAMFMQKAKKRGGSGDNSAGSSRANTPTKPNGKSSKRKALAESGLTGTPSPLSAAPVSKKSKLETATNQLNALLGGPTEGISEDAVRRYLMRKPMTTTELLQKFRSKRTGISGDQLVTTIAQILKKLNPEKQTIKGKLYLSIKA